MVYCGKPSLGCESCRQRKTRCDKVAPACGQCTRANRECPGYRNQLDLMFRSENNTVIGKVKIGEPSKSQETSNSPARTYQGSSKSKSKKLAKLMQPNGYDNHIKVTHVENEVSQGPQIYSQVLGRGFTIPEAKPFLGSCFLNPTVEERALGYFNTKSSLWLRNHDLADELCNFGDDRDPLFTSISAVGLASYANSIHASELSNRARIDYIKALRLTNAALRSPTEARKDSTLFSVIILSIFEVVTGSDEHSLEAWGEHINGASALLKLRGMEQFQTRAGQRLFMQVVSNVMISCVQRTVRIPDHIATLRESGSKFMPKAVWRGFEVSGIIFDFTNFRAAVRECEIVGPKAIIAAALEIDRRFSAAFSEPEASWKYTIVYSDYDDEFIWNRRYDVYDDYWASQIWNGMRTCRIFLHEIVRDQLLAASTAITPIFEVEACKEQNKESITTMLSMQADILASVPSYFPETLSDETASIMEASRGYFVLWPLYVAGVMDLATQPTKTWVIRRLRDVASRIGLQQATILANVLEHHRHITAWDTKPAPRLRKDGTFFGWTAASGTGTVRPDWWDIEISEMPEVASFGVEEAVIDSGKKFAFRASICETDPLGAAIEETLGMS